MTQLDLLPVYPRASQQQLWTLLESFRRGDRHTVLSAIEQLGIYALSQRTGELKALGWPIKSKMIKTPSGKHVAEYSL